MGLLITGFAVPFLNGSANGFSTMKPATLLASFGAWAVAYILFRQAVKELTKLRED
jgi:hypothetical protein